MIRLTNNEIWLIALLSLADGVTSYIGLNFGLAELNLIVSRLIRIIGNIAPILWVPIETGMAYLFYVLIKRIRRENRLSSPYEDIIFIILASVVVNNIIQVMVYVGL